VDIGRSAGTARQLHTATLLPNGKVLVAGGLSGIVTNGAELYNPVTGTWTNTGSMTTARYAHNGHAIASTEKFGIGRDEQRGNVPLRKLYDPATGTWTTTRALNAARNSHVAALLINGKVLVAGGTGEQRHDQRAELYDGRSRIHEHMAATISNFTSPMSWAPAWL